MTTRRKKERKMSKSSPEKKIEKPKRGRPKRRKRSESTPEPESGDESKQAEPEVTPEGDTNTGTAKDSTPEEIQAGQDDKQVWQVKTADTSSDTGEIQKLKICLKRPSTTPERVDQSPRSRKKLNRNTSQSDASGTDVDDTRRSRHRARKSTRESRDEPLETAPCGQSVSMSKPADAVSEESIKSKDKEDEEHSKNTKQTDVPVAHPKPQEKEDQKQSNDNSDLEKKEQQGPDEVTEQELKAMDSDNKEDLVNEAEPLCTDSSKEIGSQQSETEGKVEICKIPEQKVSADSESIDSSGISTETKSSEESNSEKKIASQTDSQKSETKQDSSTENTAKDSLHNECSKASAPVEKENCNINNVVKSENNVESKEIVILNHSEDKNVVNNKENESPTNKAVEQLTERLEGTNHVGDSLNAVPARKRRWGKLTSSSKPTLVSISTDSLKDIISDVQPAELEEIMPEKKERRVREEKKERREEKKERRDEKKERERMERPLLPTYTIENDVGVQSKEKLNDVTPSNISAHRKIVLVGDEASAPPLSPPRHSISSVLHISNLVRPFTLPQLKNLLQRTGKIVEGGFWIDGIKSKCYVQYETEDQAVETRHALHGVTWPMSNPKTLNVDFATEKDLDAARQCDDAAAAGGAPQTGKTPVQDAVKQEYGWDNSKNDRLSENHWERKKAVREWDVGKTEKDKEKVLERRKPHSPQHSPARKFKKTEEEPAPAKMLDDLFKKTKATPYIYWLPLTAETIAVKEEQRRQHMAEHERRLQQLRREPRVRR